MTPEFSNPAARRHWGEYFAQVDRLLSRTGLDGDELRRELEMHVVDSMATGSQDGDELERLKAALTRLGRPIDYLRPTMAEQFIERGARTYNPIAILKGLFHTVVAGTGRALAALLFGLGYLLIAIFAAMALSKPFWPDQVGLFRNDDGTMSAGIVARSAGAEELLGWWSIPLALIFALLVYVALTKGLRTLLRH